MEKIAKIIPAISLDEKNKIEYLQNKTDVVLDNVDKKGNMFLYNPLKFCFNFKAIIILKK